MTTDPKEILREVATATFALFNESERKGVAFGLFPAVKMREAEEQLVERGVDTKRNSLAVALMEVASRTPAVGGVSLSALSRVVSRRNTRCAHATEKTISHNRGMLARRCADCGAVNLLDGRGFRGGAK